MPVNCIRTKNKKKYVQVYDKETGTSKDVDVKVIRTGDERAAVTGDIQEGQEVLVKEVKVNTNNNNKRMGPPM